MLLLEDRTIRKLVCDDQYTELVSQLKTDALTSANSSLAEKLRPILAKMALYHSLPQLRVTISEEGILMHSSYTGILKKEVASDQSLKALRESLKSGELGFDADIDELNKFIEINILNYPLIAASECYTLKADPGPRHTTENLTTNKHFSI